MLVYDGSTSNIVDVYGSFVTLRGLGYRPKSGDVHSVRLMGGARNVSVEANDFGGIGNVAVSANSGNTANIVIRNNVFQNLENTAVYIGCHDGSCSSIRLLFETNLIMGVRSPDPNSVGYGIEVKLNSWGVLRDNTIVDTKGPPIMVYGSARGDMTTVEGNYVEGSRNEGGIVIGGGPAIVRNNVAVNNAYGGISAQNYNRRNLQQSVWILYNTLINNGDSGINTQGWVAGNNNIIAYNAILPKVQTPAVRPPSPTAMIVGNVACSASCFVNSSVPPYDLWPAEKSPLVDAAKRTTAEWNTVDDFMGEVRREQPDVGAFERTASRNDHRVSGTVLRPPRMPRR